MIIVLNNYKSLSVNFTKHLLTCWLVVNDLAFYFVFDFLLFFAISLNFLLFFEFLSQIANFLLFFDFLPSETLAISVTRLKDIGSLILD